LVCQKQYQDLLNSIQPLEQKSTEFIPTKAAMTQLCANQVATFKGDSRELPKDENGALVAQVINQYTKDGAFKAYELLDKMLGSGKETPCAIDALRFLLQLELDPEGNMKRPAECAKRKDKLSNAICLSAIAMYFKQTDPLQARDNAQKALVEASDTAFPINWITELRSIVKIEPSQSSFVKQSTASDSWKTILLQDTDAPSVMLDLILPMIGLEAVKKSLVDMYHRFKLARERGDGSASSYNGKRATTFYYLVHFML
jgi:hypothetical protein